MRERGREERERERGLYVKQIAKIERTYPIVLAPHNECWHGDIFSNIPHFLVPFLCFQNVLLNCRYTKNLLEFTEIYKSLLREYKTNNDSRAQFTRKLLENY